MSNKNTDVKTLSELVGQAGQIVDQVYFTEQPVIITKHSRPYVRVCPLNVDELDEPPIQLSGPRKAVRRSG